MTGEPDKTPDWIKRNKQRETEAKRKAAEQSQRVLESTMSIANDGQDFWKRFVAQVKINTDDLEGNFTRSIDEKIVGFTSTEYDLARSPEWSCHIHVNRYSVRFSPDMRQLHLYYQPGGSTIRRATQFGEREYPVDLTMRGNEVCVEVGGEVLTAEEFANHSVESMVKQIRFPGP
jgi:hypothetical protein